MIGEEECQNHYKQGLDFGMSSGVTLDVKKLLEA